MIRLMNAVNRPRGRQNSLSLGSSRGWLTLAGTMEPVGLPCAARIAADVGVAPSAVAAVVVEGER